MISNCAIPTVVSWFQERVAILVGKPLNSTLANLAKNSRREIL